MRQPPLSWANEEGNPDVSILVLAYNHERYITECLDGILSQNFNGSMEVLVGEDKSTDGTAAIVENYALRFPDVIRVVTASANVGMHANNRRLIRAARGRYIAYCEGDDVWHRPDKLRRQVDMLDHRPDVVGVHSEYRQLIYMDGAPRLQHDRRQTVRRHIPALLTYKDLVARNCVQTCSVMLRTSVLKRYPDSLLAQGVYPMEDWPMFLHALESGPLLHMPESLATYRHTPNSITRADPPAMARFLRGERRLINDASSGRPELAAERHEGLIRVRRSLVALGVHTGDWNIVREALVSARQDGIPDNRRMRVIAHAMTNPYTRVLFTWATRGFYTTRTTVNTWLNSLRRER